MAEEKGPTSAQGNIPTSAPVAGPKPPIPLVIEKVGLGLDNWDRPGPTLRWMARPPPPGSDGRAAPSEGSKTLIRAALERPKGDFPPEAVVTADSS